MFPSKLGIVIAHAIEYDSAYKLRIEDLMSETTKEALLNHPLRSIRRLMAINKRRDHMVAHKMMKWTLFVIFVGLLLPNVRNKLRACDFSKLQLDECDRYWIDKRTDYSSKA